MKTELNNTGTLTLYVMNGIEEYAIKAWEEDVLQNLVEWGNSNPYPVRVVNVSDRQVIPGIRAEIIQGVLSVYPSNFTEQYGMVVWRENKLDTLLKEIGRGGTIISIENDEILEEDS